MIQKNVVGPNPLDHVCDTRYVVRYAHSNSRYLREVNIWVVMCAENIAVIAPCQVEAFSEAYHLVVITHVVVRDA